MSQKVEYIDFDKLVLWSENPGDPIDPGAKDQDVVDRALGGQSAKWSIDKLASEMGDYYDFSELPTVVYHNRKPIVYDGNRRIILGKLKHNCVTFDGYDVTRIPDFPKAIPCNVCTEEIALKNVLRKHGDSGSWKPLERDIFLNKFMKEPKSTFLKLEETTGLITSNGHLNQGFVKNEIFRDDILKEMGFEIKGNKLCSVYSDNQARSILSDLAQKIEDKKITTRLNRGKVIEVLEKKSQQLIDRNKDNDFLPVKVNFKSSTGKVQKKKITKRTL